MKIMSIACIVIFSFVVLGCNTTSTMTMSEESQRVVNIEKAQYHRNLGERYAQKKDFYNAKQHFLKAIEYDPTDYRLWGLAGLAAKDNSDFDEAIQYFLKVIELNPGDHKAYANIGIVNKWLKKYDEAISAFKTALQLNSGDLGAASYLADIYYELHDYINCEKYIKEFEHRLSQKDADLLPEKTKRNIEKSLNRFENYRTIIKGKTSKYNQNTEEVQNQVLAEISSKYFMLIKNEEFDSASKLFHYPNHYSDLELIEDMRGVSEILELLTNEFGHISNKSIFQGSASYYEVAVAGGNIEYWKKHPLFLYLTYQVEFEKEGSGYIQIFYCNINDFWQIRTVKYGLPVSRSDSKTRVMNIFQKIINLTKAKEKNDVL